MVDRLYEQSCGILCATALLILSRKELIWLQPSDPYNGVVLCQPGFRRMHCPIYSRADVNIHLAAGLNSPITACQMNGRELEFRRQTMVGGEIPVSLKEGWNWLTVEN